MNKLFSLLLLFSSFFYFLFAEEVEIHPKEQQTLMQKALEKVIAKEKFFLLVNGDYQKTKEDVVTKAEKDRLEHKSDLPASLEALPGIELPPEHKQLQARESEHKEYHQEVKYKLDKLLVNLLIDNSVSESTFASVQTVMQQFEKSCPIKIQLSIKKIPMLVPAPIAIKPKATQTLTTDMILLITLSSLLLISWIYFAFKSRQKIPVVHESKASQPVIQPIKENYDLPFFQEKKIFLQSMQENPVIFTQYWKNLQSEEQRNLTQLLQGPILQQIFQDLKMPALSAENALTIDSESLQKLKILLQEWLHFRQLQQEKMNHPLGILLYWEDSALQGLVTSLAPINQAVVLQSINPTRARTILESFTSHQRQKFWAATVELSQMDAAAIRSIDQQLRLHIQEYRHEHFSLAQENHLHWEKVIQSDLLLNEIETYRPDLYQKFKKYRWQLLDLLNTPLDLWSEVLEEIDNQLLGQGLFDAPEKLIQLILKNMPPSRAKMVQAEFLSSKNTAKAELQQAKIQLTTTFREHLL